MTSLIRRFYMGSVPNWWRFNICRLRRSRYDVKWRIVFLRLPTSNQRPTRTSYYWNKKTLIGSVAIYTWSIGHDAYTVGQLNQTTQSFRRHYLPARIKANFVRTGMKYWPLSTLINEIIHLSRNWRMYSLI